MESFSTLNLNFDAKNEMIQRFFFLEQKVTFCHSVIKCIHLYFSEKGNKDSFTLQDTTPA